MNAYKSRRPVVICVFLLFLIGCWGGLGYYIDISPSSTLPTKVLSLLHQIFLTGFQDMNITLYNQNSTLIDNTLVDFGNSHNRTTAINNIITDVTKSPKKSKTVGNRTTNINNSRSSTSISMHGKNITFYITTLKWKGRLGNHMFQYASLLGMARAQDRRLIVTPGSYLQNVFKLQHVGSQAGLYSWQVLHEGGLATFDSNMMHLPLKDLRIHGFFQSFRYFEHIADEVRQEFTFQDSVTNAASLLLHGLYVKHNASLAIGVHVRRGDFMKRHMRKGGYVSPNKSYFMKAFNLMKSKFPGRNITFLVATDDLNWCKANLVGKGVVTLPAASPQVHLAVLKSCDHVIISGGTFGYWGAWMAAGHVIYYTGFMRSDTSGGKRFRPKDYYPPLWVGLGD